MKKANLFIISDLHLSAGYNEETKSYSREEDFFFDNEFRRFLEHLEKEFPGSNHLIINGDVFDFLQVNGDFAAKMEKEGKAKLERSERDYGLGTEPDKTVLKLQRIMDGHKTFFAALRNFLANGNELSIISGNHDIELFWEKVREELANILSNKDAAIKNKIKFYPWFYYDKDNGIYIEHGNQYDNWNSFKIIINPVMPEPDKKEKILLPFGSFFVRYFFNKVEDFNPFADNIKPSSRYMAWAFKTHPLRSLRLLRRYVPALFKAFFRSGGLSKAQEAGLIKEAEPRFNAIIQETGLSRETLDKLNSKMIPPVTRGKLAFIINSAWLGTIVFMLLIFALALFIQQIFALSFWSLLTSLLGLLFPVVQWLISKFRKDQTGKILRGIKKEILKEVKIIVMGHTHDPDIRKIGEDCWYYNTSTWTTVFSDEERLIREEKQFALLKIKLTDKGSDAQLMRWNDAVGECEPLILFEKQKNA
ncbi:MAG: metallophosphoesterase [Nitrospirota bacterium]